MLKIPGPASKRMLPMIFVRLSKKTVHLFSDIFPSSQSQIGRMLGNMLESPHRKKTVSHENELCARRDCCVYSFYRSLQRLKSSLPSFSPFSLGRPTHSFPFLWIIKIDIWISFGTQRGIYPLCGAHRDKLFHIVTTLWMLGAMTNQENST